MSRKVTTNEFSYAKELIGKKYTIKEVAGLLKRSTTCIKWIKDALTYSDYVKNSKAVHDKLKKPEATVKKEKTDYSGALLSESKRLRESIDKLIEALERLSIQYTEAKLVTASDDEPKTLFDRNGSDAR